MDGYVKESLIARLQCNYRKIRLNIKGRISTFLLNNPNPKVKLEAAEAYDNALHELKFDPSILSEEHLLGWMIHNNFWDVERETQLEKVSNDITAMKKELYRSIDNPNLRTRIQNNLSIAKKMHYDLFVKRNKYNSITKEGIAKSVYNRCIVGLSLIKPDGAPYWLGDCSDKPDEYIDKTIVYLHENAISDSDIRHIARSDPWFGLWGMSGPSLFQCSPYELNEEQYQLATWSKIYSRVRDHHECPPDNVIENDDALDGWMILQSEQSEKNKYKKQVEGKLSDKVANAHEVYLMASSKEEASKIESLNEGAAAYIKKMRMDALKSAGKMHELEMPDTQQRLITEFNQKNQNRK